VFAEALDTVFAHLDVELDRPLREVVFGDDADLLDRTEFAQPALFALGVALARLLDSWGVRPDRVAGHSIGEIAAAHVAGVLSLADACRLVAARGRLMQALPAGGAMVSLVASEDEVTPLLGDGVAIAAVNGPRAVVISGAEGPVLDIAEKFEKAKRLNVSHAFHSPLMDPMLAGFRAVVAELEFAEPSVPVVASGDVTSPEYWVAHVRDTVRFADHVAALAADGVSAFVELGPDGVLSAMVEADVVVPVLRRDREEPAALVSALAKLHVSGVDVAWARLFGRGPRAAVAPYAFQHERFWPEPLTGGGAADAGFWAAVEQEDFGDLAAQLDVDRDALGAVLPALSSWRRARDEQSLVDGWTYRVSWKPLPAGPAGSDGTWLLVVPAAHDDDPWVTAVAGALGPAVPRL
ncbi:acyltransferase domain-containing protein, partial [Amycolatopsis sp. SID8362]|uniref:acyltransferase domain-containing protein n=1 Tax=Amycolatopsis sp. SID8362 TaxID=2690346 RepID=UPI00136DCCDE